mmetsp:Transcript_57715/g.159763  ORF Transcript_57715/g.159763 Transcript_57715/m.159763 type:complete len:307 (+) Transcript_57715:140-1060(+)
MCKLRRAGASTAPALRLQCHQLPQRRDPLQLLKLVFRLLDRVVHREELLVDEAPHAIVEGLDFLLAELLGMRPRLLDCRLPDLLPPRVQRREVRRRALGADPRHEVLHLGGDEALGLGDLRLALRLVRLHHLLQVVDGVGVHVADLGAVIRDVPWHRDVDEHDGLLTAFHVRRQHNRDLAVGGREDDVALRDDLLQAVRRRNLSIRAAPALHELVLQQCLGLLWRPVDDSDIRVGELAEQREQQQPRHFPSAKDADARLRGALAEVPHGLHDHQLDGGAGHRHRTFADVRLRPHRLAHVDAGFGQP